MPSQRPAAAATPSLVRGAPEAERRACARTYARWRGMGSAFLQILVQRRESLWLEPCLAVLAGPGVTMRSERRSHSERRWRSPLGFLLITPSRSVPLPFDLRPPKPLVLQCSPSSPPRSRSPARTSARSRPRSRKAATRRSSTARGPGSLVRPLLTASLT